MKNNKMSISETINNLTLIEEMFAKSEDSIAIETLETAKLGLQTILRIEGCIDVFERRK